MGEMFDFGPLATVVEEHHLATIILLDTNVFINNPDYRTWKTRVKDPVFLLSSLIRDEILTVEHKCKARSSGDAERAERAKKADEAHKGLDRLLEEGDPSRGVYVEEVGWFVTSNCPSKEKLRPAIDQLGALTDTHGPNDAIFLLLTKECSEDFEGRTVVFVTGDQGLNTVGRWHRLPVYCCRELPDEGFDTWLKEQMTKPLQIDWERELRAVNQGVKDTSVEVSLTLTSKRFLRNWPVEIDNPDDIPEIETTDVIVAEGHGSIAMPNGELTFLWRVPFKPHLSVDLAQDALRGHPSPVDRSRYCEDGVPVMLFLMGESDLDFLGHESEVPEPVRRGLLNRLVWCGTPYTMEDGLPSLQSPVSMVEAFEERRKLIDLARGMFAGEADETEDTEALENGCTGYDALRRLVSARLSTHSEEEAADFIDWVTGCWDIGHTVRTRLPLESEGTVE